MFAWWRVDRYFAMDAPWAYAAQRLWRIIAPIDALRRGSEHLVVQSNLAQGVDLLHSFNIAVVAVNAEGRLGACANAAGHLHLETAGIERLAQPRKLLITDPSFSQNDFQEAIVVPHLQSRERAPLKAGDEVIKGLGDLIIAQPILEMALHQHPPCCGFRGILP